MDQSCCLRHSINSPKKYTTPSKPSKITPSGGEYQLNLLMWKDLYANNLDIARTRFEIELPFPGGFLDLLEILDRTLASVNTPTTAHMK